MSVDLSLDWHACIIARMSIISIPRVTTLIGTLAERNTLSLQKLPYGTRYVALDGPEAVVVPSGGVKAWAAVQAGSSPVTFTQVQAALAGATGAVDFNGQDLTGINDLTLDNDLTIDNGNLFVSNGDGFIGNNLSITNLVTAAGGWPMSAPIWGYNDISSGETNEPMRLWGDFEFDTIPWYADRLNGSLRTIVIWVRQAVTVGTVSVNVFKEGVVVAGTTTTIGVGQKSARLAFNMGDKPYNGGEGLDLRYTTSGDYAPTPNNELMGLIDVYSHTS